MTTLRQHRQHDDDNDKTCSTGDDPDHDGVATATAASMIKSTQRDLAQKSATKDESNMLGCKRVLESDSDDGERSDDGETAGDAATSSTALRNSLDVVVDLSVLSTAQQVLGELLGKQVFGTPIWAVRATMQDFSRHQPRAYRYQNVFAQAMKDGMTALVTLGTVPEHCWRKLPAQGWLSSTASASTVAMEASAASAAEFITRGKLKNKIFAREVQKSLFTLRHAGGCNGLSRHGGFCGVEECIKTRALWNHLKSCAAPECTYNRCLNASWELTHLKRCNTDGCHVCGTVKDYIADATLTSPCVDQPITPDGTLLDPTQTTTPVANEFVDDGNNIDELTSRLRSMALLREGASRVDEHEELVKAISMITIDVQAARRPPAIGRRGPGAAFYEGDTIHRSNVHQRIFRGADCYNASKDHSRQAKYSSTYDRAPSCSVVSETTPTTTPPPTTTTINRTRCFDGIHRRDREKQCQIYHQQSRAVPRWRSSNGGANTPATAIINNRNASPKRDSYNSGNNLDFKFDKTRNGYYNDGDARGDGLNRGSTTMSSCAVLSDGNFNRIHRREEKRRRKGEQKRYKLPSGWVAATERENQNAKFLQETRSFVATSCQNTKQGGSFASDAMITATLADSDDGNFSVDSQEDSGCGHDKHAAMSDSMDVWEETIMSDSIQEEDVTATRTRRGGSVLHTTPPDNTNNGIDDSICESTSGDGKLGTTIMNNMGKKCDLIMDHQQKLLLLLHHAHACTVDDDQDDCCCCQVTPHCASVKRMWDHVLNCRETQCPIAFCGSVTGMMVHTYDCTWDDCNVCRPLRALQKLELKEIQSSWQRVVSNSLGQRHAKLLVK